MDQGESQTRAANEANEITSMTGRDAGDPVYDSAGNMIFDGQQHYVYDAWNRLTQAYKDDAADPGQPGDLIAVYQYDGRGFRVSKAVARYDGLDPHIVTGYDRTDFLYNDGAQPPSAVGWQVLEERTAANVGSAFTVATTPNVQYTWDIRYIDAVAVRFRDMNGDGDFSDAGDETLYYTNDANMNVTALVNVAGGVVESYAYDPYGETTIISAAPSTGSAWGDGSVIITSAVFNTITYAGYRFNPETNLFDVRHRVLSAKVSWLTRDPIGYADGLNVYQYTNGGPTVSVDPSGLELIFDPNTQEYVDVAPHEAWHIHNRERTTESGPAAIAADLSYLRDSTENLSRGLSSATGQTLVERPGVSAAPFQTELREVLGNLNGKCPKLASLTGLHSLVGKLEQMFTRYKIRIDKTVPIGAFAHLPGTNVAEFLFPDLPGENMNVYSVTLFHEAIHAWYFTRNKDVTLNDTEILAYSAQAVLFLYDSLCDFEQSYTKWQRGDARSLPRSWRDWKKSWRMVRTAPFINRDGHCVSRLVEDTRDSLPRTIIPIRQVVDGKETTVNVIESDVLRVTRELGFVVSCKAIRKAFDLDTIWGGCPSMLLMCPEDIREPFK